jgi:hypothetical protein
MIGRTLDVNSQEGTMLQRGDRVPHFAVTSVDGCRVEYSTIWQRKNLVLITLPASDSDASASYISPLTLRRPEFAGRDTQCVITRDVVAGTRAPSALVADRWGEIVHAVVTGSVGDLPLVDELLVWVTYLQSQCPECEGETL